MPNSFFIKQDDTAPSMLYTIQDEDGNGIDLTGATVTFYMQDEHGVNVIEAASATIVTPGTGEVSYDWQTGDTENSGIFFGEFVVTFGDGTIRTSPDPGWISIIISSSIRG